MGDDPGNTTDTSDDPSDMRECLGRTGDTTGDASRFTRRKALTAVGTLSLGMTAGCLESVPFIGGDRVPVEPEEPGDDPDASPEEFHYILKDNGITVDELYFDTDDNDLILFYESEAGDKAESDEEISLIYILFRDGLVDRGSDVEHLYTEVVDGFDGQVEGWGVNAEWAENDLSGEYDELAVWNAIINTKVYPEAKNPYSVDDDSVAEEIEENSEVGTDG